MILRNYENIMANKLLAYNQYSGVVANGFVDGNPVIKTTSGSIVQTYTYMDNYGAIPYTNGTNSYSKTAIVIGSGSTPVTYDDYKLDTPITTISNASTTFGNIEWDADTNRYKKKITYDFMATSDLTVAEIGATFSEKNGTALIMRKVLDTPISVLANAYGRIEFYVYA